MPVIAAVPIKVSAPLRDVYLDDGDRAEPGRRGDGELDREREAPRGGNRFVMGMRR
jgi:hypothetical protein